MNDHKALDDAICMFLQTSDGLATNSDKLVALADGKWRRVDARMQAMRKAGRIRWHGGGIGKHPAGVRLHGWEVLA